MSIKNQISTKIWDSLSIGKNLHFIQCKMRRFLAIFLE